MSERNGHLNWGEWQFDYNVADTEGLSLLSGMFRGRHVFSKLSLPVIRVKYVQDEDLLHNPVFRNGCGPYNDQISWDPEDFGENLNPIAGPHHLVKISGEGGDRYVSIKSLIVQGIPTLELGVYARIGAYHIYQSWQLNDEGVVMPRVFSKGLSCNLDHWHHPYWRFNIDLDEPGNQRLNIFDGDTLVGAVNNEGSLVNADWGNARYNIENVQTGARAWIIPPQLAAEHGIIGPNEFSKFDAYVRKYRPEEDAPWPHRPEDEIGFEVHESIAEPSDLVFYCIGHLQHHADEGADHWHSIGPTLVFDVPRLPDSPGATRTIRIKGTIRLKDYGVFRDRRGETSFDRSVVLQPGASHAQVTVDAGSVGDVRATLRLRLDRDADNSVFVNFDARLFDENEVVATAGANFNVLRDASLRWAGVHLLDYHSGDPDTGDIEFTVTNATA